MTQETPVDLRPSPHLPAALAAALLLGVASLQAGPPDLTRQKQTCREVNAGLEARGADGADEFYLQDGAPVFVFSTIRGSGGRRIGERIYLEAGRIVEWLSTDPSFVARSEDRESVEKRLVDDCSRFAEKLCGAGGGPGRKASVAEGVFTGGGGRLRALETPRQGRHRVRIFHSPTRQGRRCAARRAMAVRRRSGSSRRP